MSDKGQPADVRLQLAFGVASGLGVDALCASSNRSSTAGFQRQPNLHANRRKLAWSSFWRAPRVWAGTASWALQPLDHPLSGINEHSPPKKCLFAEVPMSKAALTAPVGQRFPHPPVQHRRRLNTLLRGRGSAYLRCVTDTERKFPLA